ncbi:MAG: shikimate dehydrogenase [Candidatus Omnitrophica bacterium]|nr:shikimate dehydrogenase [Candidatus Omnitrophota bacterium]
MSAPLMRYGLVGYPVAHSFSAAMHNAAFVHYGLNAGYELFEVPPAGLLEFLKSLPRQGIAGVNVTIPHKEQAMAALSGCSAEAAAIGAVNTISVTAAGDLYGYNTDCLGFSRHIGELRIDVSVAGLIGAGGAARAAAAALAERGCRCLTIYDIDEQKSAALAERMQRQFPACRSTAVSTVRQLCAAAVNLLVNTSPIGMKPTDPLLVEPHWLPTGAFIYDVIYNPPQTALLRMAAQQGFAVSNGISMLLYQGMEAFERWIGRPAPEAVMRQALAKEMNK